MIYVNLKKYKKRVGKIRCDITKKKKKENIQIFKLIKKCLNKIKKT